MHKLFWKHYISTNNSYKSVIIKFVEMKSMKKCIESLENYFINYIVRCFEKTVYGKSFI